MSNYRVTATHDGRAWVVRVEEAAGGRLVGEVSTHGLDGIDERARAVVAGEAGEAGNRPEEATLTIGLRLHPGIQARLDHIDHLRQLVAEQTYAVEIELGDAGVSATDIGSLLSDSVTNEEIAQHGLRRYPQAVAVRFDDRGRFATTTCRACLYKDRAEYAALPPSGRNTLLFNGPLMCDVCFDDIPSRSGR